MSIESRSTSSPTSLTNQLWLLDEVVTMIVEVSVTKEIRDFLVDVILYYLTKDHIIIHTLEVIMFMTSA